MKVVEHDTLREHESRGAGDRPIETGVVRYWIKARTFVEIRPDDASGRIEVSIAGPNSERLIVAAQSGNTAYIGSEPF